MEEWVEITVVASAGAIGLLALIIVVIICMKKRRHKWDPCRIPPTPEWEPVKNIRYNPLVNELTKSVPQTMDVGQSHGYPSLISPNDYKPKGIYHSRIKIKPLTPATSHPESLSTCPKKVTPKKGKSPTRHHAHRHDLDSSTRSLSSLVPDNDDYAHEEDDVDEGYDYEEDEEEDWQHPDREEQMTSLESVGTSPEFLPQEWATSCNNPTIEFSVMYLSSTKILGVHVKRLINLCLKGQSSVLIKIKLRSPISSPTITSPSQSKTFKKFFDEENGVCATFPVSRSELIHLDLCISVVKTKFKNIKLKGKLLGHVVYSLVQIELCSEIPVTCTEILDFKKKRKSVADAIPDKSFNSYRGQLMVSLFYQTTPNRMKVLVRKASNLPKMKKVLSQPDYYVVVSMLSRGQVVTSQETKPVFRPKSSMESSNDL